MRQAFGILVLGIAFLFLFSTLCSLVISIFQLMGRMYPHDLVPAIMGIILGIGCMLGFSFGIFLVGMYLLKDKYGLDWQKWWLNKKW
jgi:hypothetical protein